MIINKLGTEFGLIHNTFKRDSECLLWVYYINYIVIIFSILVGFPSILEAAVAASVRGSVLPGTLSNLSTMLYSRYTTVSTTIGCYLSEKNCREIDPRAPSKREEANSCFLSKTRLDEKGNEYFRKRELLCSHG
jgi:hypothetical protein